MISVADIFRQVRIDLKDINEVRYSDWDLENAFNKAVRLTVNHFSDKNAEFLEKTMFMLDAPLRLQFAPPISGMLPMDLRGDTLPNDFVAVVRVTRPDGYTLHPTSTVLNRRHYMIYNGCIFAATPILLKYKFALPNVTKEESIDLPFTFFDFLAEATKVVLTKSMDELSQFIAENGEKMIPTRRYAGARIRQPWRV